VKLRGEVESHIRTKFSIPFNPGAAAQNFEHSMGQGLPSHILRVAAGKKSPVKLKVIQ
jgi:hypothetical protein